MLMMMQDHTASKKAGWHCANVTGAMRAPRWTCPASRTWCRGQCQRTQGALVLAIRKVGPDSLINGGRTHQGVQLPMGALQGSRLGPRV